MKKIRIALISIIFVILLSFYVYKINNNPEPISAIDYVVTDNYANVNLEYFYYIPSHIKKKSKVPFLIMVPGLNGRGENFVTQEFKDFADKEGMIIISPSFIFDEQNWNKQASYQFPIAWSGKALNNILNSFIAKKGIQASTLYLFGVSAGAQFVSRYSLIYPNYVTACVVNAAGGIDDPVRYQSTNFYIAVGALDEEVRKETARNFYYKAKNLGIKVVFKEYENLGHELSSEEIGDELIFINSVHSIN